MVLAFALIGLIGSIIGYYFITNIRYVVTDEVLYVKYVHFTKVIPIQSVIEVNINSIIEINENAYYEGNLNTTELGVFKLNPSYQFVIITEDNRYRLSTRMSDKQLAELKRIRPAIGVFVKPI